MTPPFTGRTRQCGLSPCDQDTSAISSLPLMRIVSSEPIRSVLMQASYSDQVESIR